MDSQNQNPQVRRVNPGTISLRQAVATPQQGQRVGVQARPNLSSGTVNVEQLLRSTMAPAEPSAMRTAMVEAAKGAQQVRVPQVTPTQIQPEPTPEELFGVPMSDAERDPFLQSLADSAPEMVEDEPLQVAEPDPVQDVLTTGSAEKIPEQTSEDGSFTANIPNVMEFCYDGNGGNQKIVLHLLAQKCLSCVELNPGAVNPIDWSSECSFRLCGNKLCPAQGVELRATGQQAVMVARITKARQNNDVGTLMKLMSALNTKDKDFQEEVLRRIGILG